MKRPGLVAIVVALALSSCAPSATTTGASPTARDARDATGAAGGEIELVESFPVETELDHADVRDAADVWPEMIDRAARSIDLAEFYASEAEGEAERSSRLAPTIAALGRAVKRGVQVRFLADERFAKTYASTLERLRGLGVVVRTIDCSTRYGGVQHAKYFVVDGVESFVGSQNFDWRALAHIQEMGVRVRSRAVAAALRDVFEADWALADRDAPSTIEARRRPATPDDATPAGETLTVYASPKGWLADEARWDLDAIVRLIDRARATVDVQVLVYSTENRDKSAFFTLDDALGRAAARGVHVRLLVSHWGAKPDTPARRSIEALAARPNVEVRVLEIPPWSGGEIPFSRVAHAKYMVVDARAAWIGTSNWEGDYFVKTRNVAVVVENGPLAPRLDRIFEDGWTSAHTRPLTAPSRPAAAALRGDAAPPSGSDPGRP